MFRDSVAKLIKHTLHLNNIFKPGNEAESFNLHCVACSVKKADNGAGIKTKFYYLLYQRSGVFKRI